MNRLPKLILAAALLGLLAVSASQALAADVVLQPAVYTTRDGVPVLTAPAVTTPVVTTVGWRRAYGYRPYGAYYGYRAPYVVARPYVYGGYYGAYPYTGYYGVTPRVYPPYVAPAYVAPYVAPGYYGYRRAW